jgi:hypothetical protein
MHYVGMSALLEGEYGLQDVLAVGVQVGEQRGGFGK